MHDCRWCLHGVHQLMCIHNPKGAEPSSTASSSSSSQVQRELPRRLARRLFDLQLLPHIVVTNPHVTRVYHAYYQLSFVF